MTENNHEDFLNYMQQALTEQETGFLNFDPKMIDDPGCVEPLKKASSLVKQAEASKSCDDVWKLHEQFMELACRDTQPMIKAYDGLQSMMRDLRCPLIGPREPVKDLAGPE